MQYKPNHNQAQTSLAAVYIAQFLSAFADNALLIMTIALLKNQSLNDQIPWLQASFLLAFIVLAPFVGAFADAQPKGRVLLIGNTIKLIGVLMVWLMEYPLLGYAVVGIGAAIYSPAKYGILGQLVASDKLVKANGLMEGSTLLAILLGVVAGGWLADRQSELGMVTILLLYALASLLNLLIQRLPIEHPYQGERPWQLIAAFYRDSRQLWQHPDARQSLVATSSFWAVGSSLRLMLFAWVPTVLLINDNQLPATLMGAVSIGIIIGAGLAAWCVSLAHTKHANWGGYLIVPLLLLLALVDSLTFTVPLLIALGAAGGWFIVPYNALLQYRGHQTIGTGRALAVQNLLENTAMMLAVNIYGWFAGWLSIQQSIVMLSIVLALSLLYVRWHQAKTFHKGY